MDFHKTELEHKIDINHATNEDKLMFQIISNILSKWKQVTTVFHAKKL